MRFLTFHPPASQVERDLEETNFQPGRFIQRTGVGSRRQPGPRLPGDRAEDGPEDGRGVKA